MAAPVHHHPAGSGAVAEPVARFFALPVPDADRAPIPTGPALRVIPGGREAVLRRRQPAAVYRRRRLVVALAAAVVLLLAAVGLVSVVGVLTATATAAPAEAPAPGASPAVDATPAATGAPVTASAVGPAPRAATGATGVSGDIVVVQPGDTLWSIALELAPGTDVRSLVDELATRHGGGVLEAGERLDVSGLVEG